MGSFSFTDFIYMPENAVYRDWYFHTTGGISSRLKLGYRLALELEKCHSQSIFFGGIHPESITITSSGQPQIVKKIENDTLLSASEDTCIDPLVALGRCLPSLLSDIFSYAVILFQLLTLCHPFMGEEYEKDQESAEGSRQYRKKHLSLYDFIGDTRGINHNDQYEFLTSMNISPDLMILFDRMFVVGKTTPGKRPTIADFKVACLRSLQQIRVCNHHMNSALEYYGTEYVCPYCKKTCPPYAQATFGIHLTTEKPYLIRDTLKGGFQRGRIDLETGKMSVYDDPIKITESCFSKDALSVDGIICIFSHINIFDYSGNKRSVISIKNTGGSPIKCNAWPEEIAPGSTLEKEDIYDSFTLSVNASPTLNADTVDVHPYGKLRISYFIKVNKGGLL